MNYKLQKEIIGLICRSVRRDQNNIKDSSLKKGTEQSLPQKWAIRLTVEGNLRFLSHHDMMRALERTMSRAKLPLHFSQGFNPRPVMSLTLPRPVGVASKDDLLVVSLDEPIEPSQLLDQMGKASPKGMLPIAASPLEVGKSPRTKKALFQLELDQDREETLSRRIAELSQLQNWTIQRYVPGKGKAAPTTQPLDLKPMIAEIQIRDHSLLFTLTPINDSWARPAEVLRLVGLEERIDLARLVRTSVDYGL